MTNSRSLAEFKHRFGDLWIWAAGLGLMLSLWMLLLREQMDLLAALLIAGVLLMVTVQNKATGVILTLGYLTVLGDIRRMVAAYFGQPRLDLLLIVGPLVVFILALPLLLRLRLKDRLSKAMLLFLLVMILEMFNPQQGGITVGVTGALFYVVPVLWFWVGREIASPVVVGRLLYNCVFPLAIMAAVMGLCQTFIGFLPYQQTWIKLVAGSYHSLHVGASIRAFGLSVSPAEYATLLGCGAAGTAAAYLGAKRLWIAAFPLLVLGVVLASGRTLVLKLILALAIVWTLRKGKNLSTLVLVRLGGFTILGLFMVFLAASRFSSSSAGATHGKGSAVQDALAHQAGGLAHPTDQKYSTAGTHGKMILDGLKQGFINPLGHGLGATTLAARQFGGDTTTASSEIDFTDMFISLGAVGGLLYLYIIFGTIGLAIRYVQQVPKEISLPVLAILATTLSTWLIAGQYSTSSMVLFLIGALVHTESGNRTTVEDEVVKPTIMKNQVLSQAL